MSAAAGLVQLAARSGNIHAALGIDGTAVTVRQPVLSWDGTAATIRTTIMFGPYPDQVEATQVLVWIGDSPAPEVLTLTGPLGLPPGVPIGFDLELAVATAAT